MLEIFGKLYYINLDQIVETCKFNPEQEIKYDENNDPIIEVNIFKYETIKTCIDRVLSEMDSVDDEDIYVFAEKSLSPSFKMAYNTLIKYKIIIEDDGEQ